MGRKYAAMVFILMLSLFLPSRQALAKTPQPTDMFYVNDYANVIDAEAEEEMVRYGNQLYEASGAQVVLVTVDFTDGIALEDYAYDLFNAWGIGSADKNNGVLILMSIGDDDYWTMQGEGLEDTLTSGEISGILQEHLEPDFAAKEYSVGAEKVYGAFIERLGGEWKTDAETSQEGTETASGQYVFDEAGILNSKASEYINGRSSELKEYYNAAFYLVTKDRSDEELTIRDDAIKAFVNCKADSRDMILLLYKEDDDYWLLPGEAAEGFATEEVLVDILDRDLEPEFAAKDYSQGAIAVADRIYELMENSYRPVKERSKKEAESSGGKAAKDSAELDESEKQTTLAFLLFAVIVVMLSGIGRRRYNRRNYDTYYNNGPEHHPGWGGPSRNSWGTGPVGGGAPREDRTQQRGAGRSGGTSYSGSDSGSSGGFFGGGGSSRGGGAGRSSGGFGGSSSSGHSSGGGHFSGGGRASSGSGGSSGAGRSSSGGGGSTRGGGAGRKK